MLPVFNNYRAHLIVFVLALVSTQLFAQQIVYDLKQDWVYYNSEHGGFLPVGEQDLQSKTISFKLSDSEFDKFYLTIGVHHKAYLFHRKKLLATLPIGISSYRIDSLRRLIDSEEPFLTIYGNKLLPELTTEVRTKYLASSELEVYQPIRFANNFSNFFYLAATLIFVFFVFLKAQFPELTNQYLLVHKVFRIRTVDESIYKIQHLGFPNNLFIAFISLILSLLLLSFMYFFPGQLHFMDISPATSSFWELALSWLQIFLVLVVLLILKYLLTVLMSSAFALKIGNVHYASSLRFLMLFAMAVLMLTIIELIMVGVIPDTIFWIVSVLAIIVMEVILFFKLTLLTTHRLLYIITYLCATELIPMVILFKLVTV